MDTRRKKIKLQCQRCGEIYTLRGKKDRFGNVDTGLKRCICDNEDEFRILSDDI